MFGVDDINYAIWFFEFNDGGKSKAISWEEREQVAMTIVDVKLFLQQIFIGAKQRQPKGDWFAFGSLSQQRGSPGDWMLQIELSVCRLCQQRDVACSQPFYNFAITEFKQIFSLFLYFQVTFLTRNEWTAFEIPQNRQQTFRSTKFHPEQQVNSASRQRKSFLKTGRNYWSNA